MQACTLHILSTADGENRQFKADGEFFYSKEKTEIVYFQDGARVLVQIEGNGVLLDRKGDYELSLPLKEGERTIGRIGLGGALGEVEISTKKIFCAIDGDGGEFSAEYALHFSAEIQRMKLRLKIKGKKNE